MRPLKTTAALAICAALAAPPVLAGGESSASRTIAGLDPWARQICANTPTPRGKPRHHVIGARNIADGGGHLKPRVRKICGWIKRGDTAEIAGHCGSACTLYIGLGHRVCAHGYVNFAFHGPSYYGVKIPAADKRAWTQLMAGFYPEPLRSQFMASYRHLTVSWKGVNARDLAAQGVVRLCGEAGQ